MRKCIVLIALCITFYLLTDIKYGYVKNRRFGSNTRVIFLDIACTHYPRHRAKVTFGLQTFKKYNGIAFIHCAEVTNTGKFLLTIY